MAVDWRYAIKAVYGSATDHQGPIHFSKHAYAERFAKSGDQVFLYETGVRWGGCRCIFALGRVTGRTVLELPHMVDGRSFNYAVEWACEIELPFEHRGAGIPLQGIREVTGLRMTQSPGGLHRLTAKQFRFLADALRRRAESLASGRQT